MTATRWPVLSVHQPWAAALIWAGKDIENRARPIRYRGPLFIHATLHHPTWDDYLTISARTGQGWPLGWLDTRHATPAQLAAVRTRIYHTAARGVLLGAVTITGCHHASDDHHGACTPWADNGCWHWQAASPRALTAPIPVTGQRGRWYLPPHLEHAAHATLEASRA